MSEYTIHKLTTREECDEMVDASMKAWWDPYLPNIRIANPIHGYRAEDRVKSLAATKDRMWNDFQKSPNDRQWLLVKHSDGAIVGSLVLWLAPGSAFPNGCPKLDLYWWPEGEEIKLFCEEMMNQVYVPRSMWMQRPHGMWNLTVHPDHRGRGVAQLLLNFVNKQLDEQGLEGFVEATESGRPAYERAGYQVVMKVDSFIPAGKSDDWKRWYHEMGISAFYAMWRPKNGKIEPGERNKPWQQGPSIPI